MKKLVIIAIFSLAFTNLSAQEIEYGNFTDKKSAVKMEFLSPLGGNLTFGYERYLKNWMGVEGKIGIIGIGTDVDDRDARGAFVKIGPKFKLKPDFVEEGLRGSHYLRGGYIRPELAFGFYTQNENRFTPLGSEDRRESISTGTIMINYGKQYVLSNVMTLDWYLGVGYGWSTGSNNDDGDYNFGWVNGGTDSPIAFAAGFTIGFLVK